MTLITHKVNGAPRETYLADGTKVVRTCAFTPPGCHSVGCGLKLFVKDGKITKVEGDPDHPVTHGRLCVRCLTLKDYVYHPKRILHPLKRVGARGENKWEEISWDQAVDEILVKTRELQSKYGPETFLYLCGTGRQATKYQHGVCAGIFGSPNVAYTQSGWSCMGPRNSVQKSMIGGGYTEADMGYGLPGWFDNPKFELPKYILIWGKEPTKSNPDGFFGHAIIELMKRGTKLIVVDPRVTWLGVHADLVLQLRCGTDTALALALLNVIINEKLYDAEWVEKWAYGFDELVERVQQYTPEWAAQECDVPVEDIYRCARILGTAKHWGLNMGLATDQNPNGSQLVQCLLTMVGITGNLDVPGGTKIGDAFTLDFGKDTKEEKTSVALPKEVQEKAIGQKEYPMLAILLNTVHPDRMLECAETGCPYPIKVAWIGSTNLISPTNSAQPRRWYDAIRKMPLVIAQDTFLNPTIQGLADYVLPLKTFAEYEGLVMSDQGQMEGIVGSQIPAVEVGDCKSDLEIMLFLAKKAGKYDAKSSDYLNRDLARYGLTWDELKEETVRLHEIEYYKYERGLLRPDGEIGFNTTTGKFEIHSLMFEMCGDDPLPYYEAPRYTSQTRPDLALEYPLTLTTGQKSYTYFHSENRGIKELREIKPFAQVQIHPETAQKYGIQHGDWVVIENPWGKCTMQADVTPIIRKDTVAAEHGWWYPEDEPASPHLYGVWEANINMLIPHNEIGKLGFGAPYKSLICKIYRSDKIPTHNWQSLY